MGLEKLIEKAKEQLPFANGYKNDKIRVPVKNWEVLIDDQAIAPTEFDKPYYIIQFRKQYVSGIIVGWEFDTLVNGIL